MATIHSIQQKIRDRVVIDASTGCWIWQGRIEHHGYGRISIHSQHEYVHRASYRVFVGPIPDGLEIDHLCQSRACCNPTHLEAVTHAENLNRGARSLGSACVNGHERTAANTKQTSQGPRCRECLRAAGRRANARRRESVSA